MKNYFVWTKGTEDKLYKFPYIILLFIICDMLIYPVMFVYVALLQCRFGNYTDFFSYPTYELFGFVILIGIYVYISTKKLSGYEFEEISEE